MPAPPTTDGAEPQYLENQGENACNPFSEDESTSDDEQSDISLVRAPSAKSIFYYSTNQTGERERRRIQKAYGKSNTGRYPLSNPGVPTGNELFDG